MSFDPATLVYNEAGLIPAIAQDAVSGEVLMWPG
jgi:phosphoribosyl-AMP cyclohydrolase